MNIVSFLEDNPVLVTGIGVCVLCVLLLFLLNFAIEGFMSFIGKAIGMVLQQLCSLVIEAFLLVFKIINSLEIYIVLLIDALTGKTSSNGKIASLAIGVLSIASFYTTYTGMQSFVTERPIAFLITLGIQAILLSTSLRISDVLNLDKTDGNIFTSKKLITGASIFLVMGCIIAYLFNVIDLSYSIEKMLYHVLYIIVIVSAIMILFSLIKELIMASINYRTGVFLFAIYFTVLSVSSFFSYNAFVPIMYPESVRNIDTFQTYKTEVIVLLEDIDNEVDYNYYENVKEEIELELQELKGMIDETDVTAFLTDDEYGLYKNRDYFEDYIRIENEIAELEDKVEDENIKWKNWEKDLFENSGGIGKNTRTIWEEASVAHNDTIDELEHEITLLETELENLGDDIASNVNKYLSILDIVETSKDEFDCSVEIDRINALLKQSEWDENQEQLFKEAVLEIEKARIKLADINSDYNPVNNFEDMIEVYRDYVRYKNQYSNNIDQILGVVAGQDTYETELEQIQTYAYELLSSLPETQYVFYNEGNDAIRTDVLAKGDYYSTLEVLKRNANPSLSPIERNIRTFIDNKMVGIVCALMALIIDLMILFVGIILPKDIYLQKNLKSKYSEQEVRRILSNLFNKPIRR